MHQIFHVGFSSVHSQLELAICASYSMNQFCFVFKSDFYYLPYTDGQARIKITENLWVNSTVLMCVLRCRTIPTQNKAFQMCNSCVSRWQGDIYSHLHLQGFPLLLLQVVPVPKTGTYEQLLGGRVHQDRWTCISMYLFWFILLLFWFILMQQAEKWWNSIFYKQIAHLLHGQQETGQWASTQLQLHCMAMHYLQII